MLNVGLDLSLTDTGIVIMRDDGVLYAGDIKSSPEGKNIVARATRIGGIFQGIYTQLQKHVQADEELVIAIEGYSFGSRTGMGVSLGESGGIIRFMLISKFPKAKFLEIPPTQLKKFVTGKGMCEKSLMLKEIYKVYNFDTNNDNTADAYALCKLGYFKVAYDKDKRFAPWKKHEEEVLNKIEVC